MVRNFSVTTFCHSPIVLATLLLLTLESRSIILSLESPKRCKMVHPKAMRFLTKKCVIIFFCPGNENAYFCSLQCALCSAHQDSLQTITFLGSLAFYPFQRKYLLDIVVSLQEDLQCSITKCSSLSDFLHTEQTRPVIPVVTLWK